MANRDQERMRQQERKHKNAYEPVQPQELSQPYRIADEPESRSDHDLESHQSKGEEGQGHADSNGEGIVRFDKVRDGECERQERDQDKNRNRRGTSPPGAQG
ncbi:MAG TPA: hypothetical protein VNJ12_01180 [Candidatus Dormibacteraeota bacterium]|nr:hypothetical protein [Candidatus Dormibacteraeota bacterium]